MTSETITLILNIYIIFLIISASFSVLLMLCGYSLFKKANKKPFEAIIPIYNLFVLLHIVELPAFNFIIFLFPLFNIILIIYILYKLYKLFYAPKWFLIGLLIFPFIFLPILSFNKYKYKLRPLTKEELEDNEIEKTPMLMSEEEIKSLNDVPEEDLGVDSIFKSDIELIEEVAPYKATSTNAEEEIYKKEEPTEYKKEKKIEEVEVLDLNKSKKENEEEKVEIVDL